MLKNYISLNNLLKFHKLKGDLVVHNLFGIVLLKSNPTVNLHRLHILSYLSSIKHVIITKKLFDNLIGY